MTLNTFLFNVMNLLAGHLYAFLREMFTQVFSQFLIWFSECHIVIEFVRVSYIL
jgi:hypothetical protein